MKGFLGLAVGGGLLYALQHTTPYYADITAPIPVSGKPGQKVDTGVFALTVDRVHYAHALATRSFDTVRTYATDGVWVLVEATGEAGAESIALMSAQWLGRDGVRYALTQRLSTLPAYLPSQRFEPGLPRPVLMAFEVPADQASGGTLLVTPSALMPLEPEARIAMASVQPNEIRPSLEVARGDAVAPWKLGGDR